MRTLAELGRHLNLGGPCQPALPPLALLTDERRLADPLPAAARLPAGSLVVLRHYGAPEKTLLARQLAGLCRRRRLRLLVAGDPALAMAVGAGLHLPEGMTRRIAPRVRLWHRRRRTLLTAAAHGRVALARAALAGADAALLSPVFPTRSHPSAATLGPLAFRRLVAQSRIPVYALGGIDTATVGRLRRSGAIGVATVGGFG